MSALGLALAGVLTITLPIGAQANGAVANMRPGPASNTVLVWDGGSSGGHSGAIGDHPAANRTSREDALPAIMSENTP